MSSPHYFSGIVEQAKRELVWKSPAAWRLFSRGVMFTRPRVSLALLSLRKNGTTRSLRLSWATLNRVSTQINTLININHFIEQLIDSIAHLQIVESDIGTIRSLSGAFESWLRANGYLLQKEDSSIYSVSFFWPDYLNTGFSELNYAAL